jgi:hypothetical protein
MDKYAGVTATVLRGLLGDSRAPEDAQGGPEICVVSSTKTVFEALDLHCDTTG